MKKYYNETCVEAVERNGMLEWEGERFGVSNLPVFLEAHPDIAAHNGYYPFQAGEIPSVEEGQILTPFYRLQDGVIYEEWQVKER